MVRWHRCKSSNYFNKGNVCVHTWHPLMTTLFCLKFGPCFGGQTTPQNRGLFQVPGINMISIYLYHINIFTSYLIWYLYLYNVHFQKKIIQFIPSPKVLQVLQEFQTAPPRPFSQSAGASTRHRHPTHTPSRGLGGTGQVVGVRGQGGAFENHRNLLGTPPKQLGFGTWICVFFLNRFLPIC